MLRTLQLERITSLRLAIERAKAIKIIQDQNFRRRQDFRFGKRNFVKENQESKKENGRMEEKEDRKEKGRKNQGDWKKSPGRECWQCRKLSHFRAECPGNEGNAI